MRRFSVTAYGNSSIEVEISALRQARKYFGKDVPLLIDRSYGIFENGSYLSSEESKDTLYHASIDIHPDEPLTGSEWYSGRTGGYGSEHWDAAQHHKAYTDKYHNLTPELDVFYPAEVDSDA